MYRKLLAAVCSSGWLFSKWNGDLCLLRKLLFGGSSLEIVTGNASVHLLKITGEKNQSGYFEVLVC